MRKYFIIVIISSLWFGVFTSCSDFLDTSSNSVLFAEDNTLNSPSDSLYTIVGIYSLVQKLSDRYILLGELRGDLMDVTVNSSIDLKAISNHSASTSNPYCSTREYYNIINNCNFFIANLDTSIRIKGEKVMLREFALAKTIRAWAYYQLVLNFGKAVYLEKPILNVQDAIVNESSTISIDSIFEKLIEDLSPYVNTPLPGYSTDFSPFMFIPVRFLLGDMQLWLGHFEEAAILYHDLMYNKSLVVNAKYASIWKDVTFQTKSFNWRNLFSTVAGNVADGEILTTIWRENNSSDLSYMIAPETNEDRTVYEVCPSKKAIKLWVDQIYTSIGTSKTIAGDLRGKESSYDYLINSEGDNGKPYITKLLYTGAAPILYRTATLYLRYAETLNRLHKPTIALAVLNYGLNNANMVSAKINLKEITPRPAYLDFSNSRFNLNIGIRQRGLGISIIDIPVGVDSTDFVDQCILDEYALETAFEGNRYQDLMRMAKLKNKPSILADAISSKSAENSILNNLLLNPENWYLPTPGN